MHERSLHRFVSEREDMKGEGRQEPGVEQEDWMLAGQRPTEKPSVEIEGVCANKYGLDLWSVDFKRPNMCNIHLPGNNQ